jgi:uncharacterized protein YqgV (UPF0045/DUF77 family)
MPAEGLLRKETKLFIPGGKRLYCLRRVIHTAEANLSLQVLPAVAEGEIYDIVDQVIAMVADSGLKYIVGPLETSIEGDLDTLLELVKKAQNICIAAGAPRVISIIKIDYKPDGVTMDEKIGKYH